MRFVVLGAGAIGAYVGAALTRGGSDVCLIARGPHRQAMERRGVRVLSPRGDIHVRPEVTEELEAVATADVVILGVKAYSLPELARQLGEAIPAGAAVMPAQNGIPWWFFQAFPGPLEGAVLESVDPGGVISRSIAPGQVVGCVAYPAAEMVEPGVIRHIEGTRFAIGEPDGSNSERCRRISEAFVAAGLKCPVEEQVRDQLWLKLIGNVAFNPMTALSRATLGELGLLPEVVAVVRALMEECARVGEVLGLNLPVSIERRLEAGIGVGDHRTSMLQDLEAGKQLEIDCLTGAVIEIADRLGLPVPHLRTIDACIRLLARLREREPSTMPALSN